MNPHVAARRGRTLLIRQRIATGCAAIFIALFGGLYIQLASGDDPALSTSSSTALVASSTTTDESTVTTDDSITTTDDSNVTTDDSSAATQSAPVTTSQS